MKLSDFFYAINISGGGEDGLYTLDTQTNQLLGNTVDTPCLVPHEVFLSAQRDKLYITHSGPTSNQVTSYTIGQDGIPVFAEDIQVELNSFGFVSVAPNSNPADIILDGNSAPVTKFDRYQGGTDQRLSVGQFERVTGNDIDRNANVLTALLKEDVSHGSLTLNIDGAFLVITQLDNISIEDLGASSIFSAT